MARPRPYEVLSKERNEDGKTFTVKARLNDAAKTERTLTVPAPSTAEDAARASLMIHKALMGDD